MKATEILEKITRGPNWTYISPESSGSFPILRLHDSESVASGKLVEIYLSEKGNVVYSTNGDFSQAYTGEPVRRSVNRICLAYDLPLVSDRVMREFERVKE